LTVHGQAVKNNPMRARILDWFRPTSEDHDIAHKQYLLNIVLVGLAGPGFAFGVIMLVLWIMDLSPPAGAIAGLSVQPFYILAFWLGRRGHIKLAAYIPVTVVFLVMAASFLQVGVGHISTVGIAMVVVAAGILIGAGAASLFVVLGIAVYIFSGWAQINGMIPNMLMPIETIYIDAVGMGLGLFVLVIFNWISSRELRRSLQLERDLSARLKVQSRELEEQVLQRTQSLERKASQLETTSEIAKLSSEMVDPEVLMFQAVDLIQSRFDFYHASIFMLDESGNWANLVASTGEAGRKLLAQHFRLAVGSASIIGWVTTNRIPRVSQNVDQDPFYFKIPLLSETHSELAAPLIVGSRLLGVLDIQSIQPNSFSEDDIRAIQAIADELALAVDNARLLKETQQQLERYQSSYRDLARQSWRRITRSGFKSTIRVGGRMDEEGLSEDEFRTLEQAAQKMGTVLSEDEQEISIPVRMRGEHIATIGARKIGETERWSKDEIALLEAVSGQVALALESARQYTEEHRRVSELEVVNRVSQAVSQHLRLDSLYRVVHAQINQVLGETDMYFALFDPQMEEVRFPYISENKEVIKKDPIPYGDDLTSLVIRTRQPLLLQEDSERRAKALGAEVEGIMALSWLGVPLLIGDDIIGVLVVQDNENEQRFSDDDAALLTTLASQVATALQNAQLMEQVQKTARRERLIHEITSKVRQAPNFKTILETTARELRRSLNVSSASIHLGSDIDETLQPAEFEGQNDGEDRLVHPPLEEQD
jgi:GAF domain-containing protein